MSVLYNRDFNLWIQKTVSDLKSKDMDAIDWEHLIDEIEGMGKSDRCERVWKIEIIEFRSRIERILDDSPSLKNYLTEIYPKAHRLAVARMSIVFDLPNDASISKSFALSNNFSDRFC